MAQKKKGFYGWKAVGAISLSAFFVGGSGYSFGAFLPALHAHFGWPVGQISIAMSLMMALMTLSSPGAGFFIGKFGVRKAIFAGNAIVTLAFFSLAFITKQWQFHLAYAFIGIGSGLAGMVASGTLASNWFVKKMPLAMSIINAAMGVGGLALAPLTAVLIGETGWPQTYLILAGTTLLMGVVISTLFIRNRPEELGQVPDGEIAISGPQHKSKSASVHNITTIDFTLKEAMGTSAFWMLCIIGGIPIFMMVFLMAHQINFLTKDIGLSMEAAGLAAGLVSGTSVLGTIGIGVLSLKFDIKKLAIASIGLMTLGTVLASIAKSAPLAFTYSILFGIGIGATIVSLMSLTSAYFGRTDFSKILGISMLFTIFSTSAAPISGYIYDITKSYSMAFMVAVAAGLVGFILMMFVRRPVHRNLIK